MSKTSGNNNPFFSGRKDDTLDECRTKEGNLERLKDILQEIDDPQRRLQVINSQDENGKSVLYLCIANRKIEIAKHLIQEGADVNMATTSDGTTPFILASAYGHSELVDLMIKNGANVEFGRKDKVDAAFAAAQHGHLTTLMILLENRTYTNIADKVGFKGRTPLGAAAYKGYLEIVKYLVTQHHVRVNIKDDHNHTPLQLAIRGCHSFEDSNKCKTHSAVINFLKENGAFA